MKTERVAFAVLLFDESLDVGKSRVVKKLDFYANLKIYFNNCGKTFFVPLNCHRPSDVCAFI